MSEKYKKTCQYLNYVMLLGKDKLNSIEVLNSKSLIDSYISHDQFVSINNLSREYNDMKEEIKNPETSV